MPELWLIRHGQTEWSLSGQHTGRSNISLTEEGRRQAEGVGRHLTGRSFALVLVSPLARARETCELAGFGGRAEVDPNLYEWDYGEAEGYTAQQVRQRIPGWRLWVDGPPGGETVEQVGARADAVIARAGKAAGDVLLFAHGHVLRILTARWLGLEPTGGQLFALETGSVSRLGYEHETRVIARWNLPTSP